MERPTAERTAPDPDASPRHPRLLVFACCFSLFAVTIDATVVNVALPVLGSDLDASTASLQWVVDGYTLPVAALLVAAGSVADRIGRRRVLRIGLVLFGIGSLACSVAPTTGTLIAARVLEAIGGSMLNPVSLAIIADAFPARAARSKALATWGATSGVALGLGPLVGGLLVQLTSWRTIFLINVPIVLLALVTVWIAVPESRAARPRRLDLPGQALIAVALLGLIAGLIQGPAHGWTAPGTLVPLAVALGSLLLMMPVELRRAEPLLDPRLFRDVSFSAALCAAILALAAWSAFVLGFSLELQTDRGYPPLVTGAALLPAGAAILVASRFSSHLVARQRPRLAMGLAGAATAAGSITLALFGAGAAPVFLLIAVLAVGAGFGLVNVPISSLALKGLPSDRSATASALAATARRSGTAVGVALLGSFLPGDQLHGFNRADVSGLTPLWWLIAAAGVAIVFIAALPVKGSSTRSTRTAQHSERSPERS